MVMSTRTPWCCVALFFVLTSVSAVQKLKSIEDLKKINFGQSVPKHSLLLLYWFANTVVIDNNNVIRLTFNPNSNDYGSHHYGNFERMLDPLPQGNVRYRYFTVGNLHQERSTELPSYVLFPTTGYEGDNRDRIIFRVREHNGGWQDLQVIDQVYITQHYETHEQQGTRYDPDHTYQVTTRLLNNIRAFSADGNGRNHLTQLRDRFGSNADDSQLRLIRNTWGNLACLGLLLFIVINEKYSSKRPNNRPQPAPRRNTRPDFVVNITDNTDHIASGTYARHLWDQGNGIMLDVTTGKGGKARICWRNVPRHYLQEGVMVALYKNNEDEEAMASKTIGNGSDSYDTSVPLNDSLQVRLHKVKRLFCFWSSLGEEICRGTVFKNYTEAVNINGYNANLQLFVKDGKACARLYVKKSFRDWRSEFSNSWVGFYSSADKATNSYEWWQWQWVTKFEQNTHFQDYFHDVYDYHSSMVIAPGVQARFIINNDIVKAITPSWRD